MSDLYLIIWGLIVIFISTIFLYYIIKKDVIDYEICSSENFY
jgi:hypothetical protein